MGRTLPILCTHRPAIRLSLHLKCSLVDHRFDGQGHARLQHGPLAWAAKVRHLGILMQFAPNTMSTKIAHDRVSGRLSQGLDRMANVTNSVAGPCHLDGRGQALLSGVAQTLALSVHRPHANRGGVIADEAFSDDANIQADQVAGIDDLRTGNAMHHFVIERNTRLPRKSTISKERTDEASLPEPVPREVV